MIKDLDDVLFRDVGGKIAADGRFELSSFHYSYVTLLSLLSEFYWCIFDTNQSVSQRFDSFFYSITCNN